MSNKKYCEPTEKNLARFIYKYIGMNNLKLGTDEGSTDLRVATSVWMDRRKRLKDKEL